MDVSRCGCGWAFGSNNNVMNKHCWNRSCPFSYYSQHDGDSGNCRCLQQNYACTWLDDDDDGDDRGETPPKRPQTHIAS